jgi:hypothetical protein
LTRDNAGATKYTIKNSANKPVAMSTGPPAPEVRVNLCGVAGSSDMVGF